MAAPVATILCTCPAILDAFVLGSKKMAASVAAPGLMTKERLWRFVVAAKMFRVSSRSCLLFLSYFCAVSRSFFLLFVGICRNSYPFCAIKI